MKFTKVIFGHVVSVEPDFPRYVVALHTATFSEVHEYRTLLGAFLAARRLAKERDNGWAERAVTLVIDARTGRNIFGFKCSQKYYAETRFVKF